MISEDCDISSAKIKDDLLVDVCNECITCLARVSVMCPFGSLVRGLGFDACRIMG